MDTGLLFQALITLIACSFIINRACESFDLAASHLGRNMPPGIRGATVNAIGSSLPELLTTFFLLFVYHDQAGFAAGMATCAGSAIFNLTVIPALCILGVVGWRAKGSKGKSEIQIQKRTIIRDGAFLLFAELVLFGFLGQSKLAWWAGGLLALVYVFYAVALIIQVRKTQHHEGTNAFEGRNVEEGAGFLQHLCMLDFHQLVYKGAPLNTQRAWVVLGLATVMIGASCHFLATAVIDSAKALQIAPYFTALILGAAATSVPDTILSVRDARRGNYDDAVSNAVGSNIFDITIALGLPLLLYGLFYQDVTLSSSAAESADLNALRILLVVATAMILLVFIIGRNLSRLKAYLFLLIYGLWTVYVIGRADGWEWILRLTS
ncbi:MAG: pseudouridine synthase [Myxococcales bacterium]|nr:pseudouridine synthase [Myxococcales bacterium]